METALKIYLKENEELIDTVVETETGLIVRFPPCLLEKNPEAALKIISEVERNFKGGWLGTVQNSLFIPSLATRLKRNLAECVDITAELNSIGKITEILQPKTDEERAFSHIEIPLPQIITAPSAAPVETHDSMQKKDSTEENPKDSIEENILKLRNYFVPKLSALEVHNAVSYLLKEGMTKSQIAEKVGAGESTIYKFSTAKKTDSIEKKNSLTG
jgi:hypothetical protein